MTYEVKDLRDTIQRAVSSQRSKTITVLSSLLAVEDALGYIPSEAIEEVAHFTEATVNDVWGVASFYTNFRFTPPGKHLIEVCWGPSCHLTGAPGILRTLLDYLGIATEGETADHSITLKYNTCLGACAQAPVVSIDHQLVGRMTAEEARERVRRLLAGAEAGATL